MGPIAEIAAPVLAPVLQPIMQDVGKAIGGALDGALGGLTGSLTGGPLGGLTGSLDGIAKGLGGGQQGVQGGVQPKPFDQQIADIQNMLKQLASEVGQQHGICSPQPYPFQPPSGIHHHHIDNPISRMPHFGDGGFNGGRVSGGGSFGNGGVNGSSSGDDWATQAANATGGKSYDQLQSDLQAAEQSGDPAKIAQATNNIQKYDNFVSMLSDAEKKQNDTIAQIIGNLK